MFMTSNIIAALVTLLLSALVIYVVGRLNLGLRVKSFGSALVAAVVIAVVSYVLLWLLGRLGITFENGLIGAILWLVVSAVVLLISGRLVSGISVRGFGGALVAAVAIAVGYWLIGLLLNMLGIAV